VEESNQVSSFVFGKLGEFVSQIFLPHVQHVFTIQLVVEGMLGCIVKPIACHAFSLCK
jgi:hypothetical protein